MVFNQQHTCQQGTEIRFKPYQLKGIGTCNEGGKNQNRQQIRRPDLESKNKRDIFTTQR